MAISTTSFTKGNKGKPPGTKHRRTVVKDKLGLSSWEKMTEYILTDGINKYIHELSTLRGKDYIVCFDQILEYVKPKLTRSQVEVNANVHIDTISFE